MSEAHTEAMPRPWLLALVEAVVTAAVGLLAAGMLALISGAVTPMSIMMAITAGALAAAWLLVGTLVGGWAPMLRVWPRIGVMSVLVLVAIFACIGYLGDPDRFMLIIGAFFLVFTVPAIIATGILGVAIGSAIVRRRAQQGR